MIDISVGISSINNNAGAIQAITTTVLVIVTGVYAFHTAKTAKSMERTEEMQTRPQLAIFLEQREDNLSLVNLVIANYGNGLARNIEFSAIGKNIVLDLAREEKTIKTFRVIKNGIKTLGPKQEYRAWLMSVIGRVDELQSNRTNIRVRYENVDGSKKYKESYRLDFNSLPEYQLGKPVEYKISESLENIAKRVASIERKIGR
jgi:hypothetical protein